MTAPPNCKRTIDHIPDIIANFDNVRTKKNLYYEKTYLALRMSMSLFVENFMIAESLYSLPPYMDVDTLPKN